MCGSPIFRIGFEHHFAGRVEGFDGVRAGADRFGFRVVFGVFVKHEARTSGQIPQQVGVGGGKGELDRVGVHRFGLVEAGHLVGVVVLLLLELVDGPGHVVGVKFVAIGETHVAVEMERVGFAVLGNVPGFRETRLHFVVGVSRQQAFVNVADQHLFDGGTGLMTDVKTDGGEFQSDGDGIGLAFGSGSAVCAGIAYHDDGDDDGDDRDHAHQDADPPFRPVPFR